MIRREKQGSFAQALVVLARNEAPEGMAMPIILGGRRYRPRRYLTSHTRKAFSGNSLESKGTFTVRDRPDARVRATHLKLGVLIKANQRIERYRYTANGYNLLRYAANKAVAADLNRVMPKRGHVWMGFLIPFRRIPVAVKGKLGVEFTLTPFLPGSSQTIRIVYQPASDRSFANRHYNYGVSRISRPR